MYADSIKMELLILMNKHNYETDRNNAQ